MSSAKEKTAGYLQPAFLICAAVLALVGAGMSVARRKLGLYLEKEPLPLKRSLALLDEGALAPYEVIARQTIANEEILESLGTSDYIQWVLDDPRQPAESPIRRAMLFVTYYALPDRVPHVPEECYTGGGYQRLGTEDVRLRIGGPEQGREVPGRYLVFEMSGAALAPGAHRFPVLYLFRVNGEYAGNRDRARVALNRNIFSPYAYFCKVELVFNQTQATPTKDQAVAAAERLLTAILPVLERNHWPDGPQTEVGGHPPAP
jgi:hypothetical protein